jgi:hypothetical protein
MLALLPYTTTFSKGSVSSGKYISLHERSRQTHLSCLLYDHTDFGNTIGERNLMMLVAAYVTSDRATNYMQCIRYKLGSLPSDGTSMYSPTLCRLMAQVHPLLFIKGRLHDGQNMRFDLRPLPYPLRTLEVVDGDQPWQTVATHRVLELCRTNGTVVDPMHVVHVTSTSERRVEWNRAGYIREVALSDPVEVVPDEQSFQFHGYLLTEKTGTGKTHVVVRAIQAHSGTEADGTMPDRLFLPRTAIIVVPSHTMSNWIQTIKGIWPTCRVMELIRRRSFRGLSSTLSGLDIVLLSRDVLFTATGLKKHLPPHCPRS